METNLLDELTKLTDQYFDKMSLSLASSKYIRMSEEKLRKLGTQQLNTLIVSSDSARHQGCCENCPDRPSVADSYRIQGEFDAAKAALHQINIVLEHKYHTAPIPFDENMRCFDTRGW